MCPAAEPGPLRRATAADLPGLVGLCNASLTHAEVVSDDLEALLFAEPAPASFVIDQTDAVAFVVDSPDGREPIGMIGVTLASVFGEPSAHLQVLAVAPGARRRGIARVLVDAAEEWAIERGAATLTVGGGAPFYLFTGVDSRWTDALCAFEALGYERVDAELDLVCPTRRKAARTAAHGTAASTTSAVTVAAVRDTDTAAALAEFATTHWPLWAAEFDRAGAAGTVFVATDPTSGAVLGAAAHSVGRLGVIGPVAVDPNTQGRGVGSALMAAVCSELSVAGLDEAEIAWTSTVRFYSLACGATVGRSSLLLRRELGLRLASSP